LLEDFLKICFCSVFFSKDKKKMGKKYVNFKEKFDTEISNKDLSFRDLVDKYLLVLKETGTELKDS